MWEGQQSKAATMGDGITCEASTRGGLIFQGQIGASEFRPDPKHAANVRDIGADDLVGSHYGRGDVQIAKEGIGWVAQSSPSWTMKTQPEPCVPKHKQQLALSDILPNHYHRTPAQIGDGAIQKCLVSEPNLEPREAPNPVFKMKAASRSCLRRRRRRDAARWKSLNDSNCEQGDASTDAEDDKRAAEEELLADQGHGLLEQLRAGGEARTAAIQRFRQLAFSDKLSSKVAQHALEQATMAEASALVTSMHGRVVAAIHCMYANYVLQKIIETMPAASFSFIARELLGGGREVARHKFGCRVLCRLLEHSVPVDPSVAQLFNEVLDDAARLCQHCFGAYVMLHMLEFGLPEYRGRVLSALRHSLLEIATHKKGSQVIGLALTLNLLHEGRTIADDLLGLGDELVSLAKSKHGSSLVKQMLSMVEYQQRVAALLRPTRQLSLQRRNLLGLLDDTACKYGEDPDLA